MSHVMDLLRLYLTLRALARRLAAPLRSRKVRIAIATLGALYFAQRGYDVSDEFMVAVITLGASLILGTAIEDAGTKSNGGAPGDS